MSITEFEKSIRIPKVRIIEPTPDELIDIAAYFNMPIDVLVLKDLKKLHQFDDHNIKMLILDVDGTMTDGGMYFTENGDQIKRYNAKDGIAIKALVKKGTKVGIISHGKKFQVIKDRADLLGIEHVYVGSESKLEILNGWLKNLDIKLEEVAYVGDDINDMDIIEAVGLTACPADAVSEVKRKVDIILQKNGGHGCIRELYDEWLS
ncbi:HAD-IIIA family hydrolase [Paracrocinitomix mangrovi]|uniref:KdsC family phosphatase n=1 Tax=Paracrocinitomix mangrovi TaxID=2862509 RepID=UPI001C8DF526|nr:HAD-IIIA family hydrolase [Paracrocinitomix mangrovi]UKN02210.1 HAD-IIIA family hydrolase [Paracrocinitomix mangrovi]